MASRPVTRMIGRRVGGFSLVAAVCAALLALGCSSAVAGVSPSAPAPVVAPAAVPAAGAVTSAAVKYMVGEHACAAPGSRSWSCFALKYSAVPKGTPGARAYSAHAVGHGPAGGFSPADLATAYGYTPSAATNQTVAVVDAWDDPSALADLQAFDRHYGLPVDTSATFSKVNGSGASSPLPQPDKNWAVEISLDVQAVRAVCNKCKIILVEASAADATQLAAAVNTAVRLHATEVSNSYGGPEDKSNPLPSSIVNSYNHPGVVITGSTGDDGWYDWDYANDGSGGWGDNAPDSPASYPTVVAVAGTTLTVNPDGSRLSEKVWNSNGPSDDNGLQPTSNWLGGRGASGGGCSTIYTAPDFQRAAAGFANTGCGIKRLAGDVAADADPSTGLAIYDSSPPPGQGFATGWNTIGGTSLSSPLIAAMWALAGGATDAALPGGTLYDRYRYGTAQASYLNDVTEGGNAFCDQVDTATCRAQLDSDLPDVSANPTSNPNDVYNFNASYQDGWAGLLDCGFPYTHGHTTPSSTGAECNAAPGYDGPSGIGTPKGLTVFKSMLPHATIAPPALKLNTAAVFHAATVVDPVGAGPYAYQWVWGDGARTSTSSATASHAFTKSGSYVVALGVTDNLNRTGTVYRTVTVGMPLTARISGPTTAHANVVTTYASSGSVDPNTGGVITAWRWRAGSTASNATIVGTAATLHVTYHNKGKHILLLDVTDNEGLHTTTSVTVNVI
jgi:hypothetical protein